MAPEISGFFNTLPLLSSHIQTKLMAFRTKMTSFRPKMPQKRKFQQNFSAKNTFIAYGRCLEMTQKIIGGDMFSEKFLETGDNSNKNGQF